MKRAAYIGWVGHNNIGDEACMLAIQELLGETIRLVPWDVGKWAGKLPSICILGGGTILDIRYGRREKTLLSFMHARKVPIIVWGSGIVEFYGNTIHSEVLNILNTSSYVGVRGPISKKILDRRGYQKSIVLGDPALLLSTNKKVVKNFNPKIAINIGTAKNNLYGKEIDVLKQCNNLINKCKKVGIEVCLFSMWPVDNNILKKIAEEKRINVRLANKLKPPYTDVYDLVDFIKNFDCVIGMKLHSCVLSASANVPFISLAYREKCLDFCSSLGLKSYAIKTNKKWVDFVFEKLNSILLNKEKYIDRVRKYKNIYKTRHKKLANITKGLI